MRTNNKYRIYTRRCALLKMIITRLRKKIYENFFDLYSLHSIISNDKHRNYTNMLRITFSV